MIIVEVNYNLELKVQVLKRIGYKISNFKLSSINIYSNLKKKKKVFGA